MNKQFINDWEGSIELIISDEDTNYQISSVKAEKRFDLT